MEDSNTTNAISLSNLQSIDNINFQRLSFGRMALDILMQNNARDRENAVEITQDLLEKTIIEIKTTLLSANI